MGSKMIYECLTTTDEDICNKCNPLKFGSVIMMALATSIDAIIVGIGIAIIDTSTYQLINAIIIIATITSLAVIIGLFIGKKTGKHFGSKAEILSGLILIIIGVKILCEHLS